MHIERSTTRVTGDEEGGFTVEQTARPVRGPLAWLYIAGGVLLGVVLLVGLALILLPLALLVLVLALAAALFAKARAATRRPDTSGRRNVRVMRPDDPSR